tara:strand:- start:27 stop:293 length:267 start_codon:yes stop_codon:yes gene_type:complete
MQKYSGGQALLEHMLQGHRVSQLEAMLLLGVQNPNAEITRIKRQSFVVKTQRVPMARIIARIQQYTSCEAPADLPAREILMSEYWIEK